MTGSVGSISSPDPALVRRALDGLLEIAWEGNPPDVIHSLREQVEELPPLACMGLLEDMVDTTLLGRLVQRVVDGRAPLRVGAPLEPWQVELVDSALTPLATILGGERAARSVADLEPGQRARILFAAVSRQEGFGKLP